MGRLFWKFFLAFWLALLTAGAGVGMVVWLHQQTADDNGQELSGGPRTAFLVNATAATLRHGGLGALRNLLQEWQNRGSAHVYIVDATGQELLGRKVAAEAIAQARQRAQDPEEPRIARLETVDHREYLFFVPADERNKTVRHRLPPPSPWLPLGIGILASLGFSALLAWYLAKPIRHLRDAFAAVAAGKLDTRIGAQMGQRRDEIADLGRDFDDMTEQLQTLVGSQQRLLHDVSHELRSPLARLQAAIGLARQQPEKLATSLERIERESGRLDQLVGELLTLSRLEAGMNGAADEDIDLVELVRDIAADAHFEAQATGRQVLFYGEGEAPIQARAELLYRAFENVIRNALKYTVVGSAVEVRTERGTTPDHLLVTVLDRGPGIADSDLHAVFKPFFRSEAGAPTAGFGLGLAIARRAIQAHGGNIAAFNRTGGGLRVKILLPLTTTPQTTRLDRPCCH